MPSCDLGAAAKEWKPLPGKVCVEMSPWREKSDGGIFLPDKASGKYRPNVGVVLVSGVAAYLPGDVVIVRPYDGWWTVPYKGTHYQTENEIRWYGLALDLEESGKTIPWDACDQIVGWYDEATRTAMPGPGYTLVKRSRRKFAVEVSVNVWDDFGEAVQGKFSGEVCFQGDHPDDLLHVQWGEEDDLWLVPDRCILARMNRNGDQP